MQEEQKQQPGRTAPDGLALATFLRFALGPAVELPTREPGTLGGGQIQQFRFARRSFLILASTAGKQALRFRRSGLGGIAAFDCLFGFFSGLLGGHGSFVGGFLHPIGSV
jgi:hypothetical protein